MLIVTQRQIERLDALRLAEFRRVCAAAIRERHSDDAAHLDDGALALLVARTDSRATGEFAIRDEGTRFRIMVLALQHPELAAPEVPPDLVDLMTWPDRPDERKLSMLEARLKSDRSAAPGAARE